MTPQREREPLIVTVEGTPDPDRVADALIWLASEYRARHPEIIEARKSAVVPLDSARREAIR